MSIANPVNIRTPVMTNMGIVAADGKTNAPAIGANAPIMTLNHGSIRGDVCSAISSVLIGLSTYFSGESVCVFNRSIERLNIDELLMCGERRAERSRRRGK
jgi:hypothetical protein